MAPVSATENGFTLLEMMFVMFIVSLLIGLTSSRYSNSIERFSLRSERQALEDQIHQLPRRARMLARPVELPKDLTIKDLGDGQPALNIPEQWQLSFNPPLIIARSGACSESLITLRLKNDQQSEPATIMRYTINEFSCDLSEAL